MTISCQNVDVLAIGSISISSTPTVARIWLAPTGQTLVDQGVDTNTTISGLVVGNYDIKLVKDGYQDWTTTVSVTSGGTTPVSATLILSTGSVTISSTPSGATIYLDGSGTPSGTTTATISGLSPGTHSYILVLAGYDNATGTFSITANTNTPLSVTFAGSAYITSTPAGARIWLAASPGTPIDLGIGMDTPLILTDLTTTTTLYNYKLTLAGYADAIGTFTATAGTTVNVPVTMLTPPNITATDIDITTSETPCMIGSCTVTVVVRWSNSGQTDGTVIPNIKIDNVSQTPHTSRTVPAGGFIDETFTVTGLSAAAHTVCPDPN